VSLPGVFLALALVGALAAGGLLKWRSYRRQLVRSEAETNVRKLFDSSVSYFDREPTCCWGSCPTFERQFPATAPLTPGWGCRARAVEGGKWRPRKSYWTSETWQALNFALAAPHVLSYQYISSGENREARFTIRAVAEPDCDGQRLIYERSGRVDASLNVVEAGRGVWLAP